MKNQWLDSLIEDIASLNRNGAQILLVSSGAIALGAQHVGPAPDARSNWMKARPRRPWVRSNLAAPGLQPCRSKTWCQGQILLTLNDTEGQAGRRSYLNARDTIERLLAFGTVPVINENDTVATSEIRYGDNDRLAARVATMLGADLLVLLSDIDGLYTAPP